jgi:quinol monooxygenase YgiN
MKPLTLVATLQARPGKEWDLRAALFRLVAPTRKEPGCLTFDLHQSPDGPGRFLLYENWDGQEALDAHLQSPHIKAFLPHVGELCATFPEVKIWERV